MQQREARLSGRPFASLDVGTSYYAVAVVKASSNLTINQLRGAKTCHTGINRTAGWNIPVGLLLDSGRMPMMGCSVTKGKACWVPKMALCLVVLFPGAGREAGWRRMLQLERQMPSSSSSPYSRQ